MRKSRIKCDFSVIWYIESCIHAPVLLNIYNSFKEIDKMFGKASRLIFSLNSFYKFKNTLWALPRDWFWSWDCSRPLRPVVRCFCDRLRLSRSTVHKMVTLSFKAYVQLPGIFVRRLNMVEDPRSPPHNRFCDCSRSLRLVVQDWLRLSCAIGLIQVAN